MMNEEIPFIWTKEQDIEYRQAVERRKTAMRTKMRKGSLRWKYNLGLRDYEALLQMQHGVCAVCGKKETRHYRGYVFSLAVDHDHRTGKIRGLLCHRCNLAAGFLDSLDDVSTVALLQYLGRKIGSLI